MPRARAWEYRIGAGRDQVLAEVSSSDLAATHKQLIAVERGGGT